MSPPTQFGFAASMSAGDMTTRAIVADSEVLDVPADPFDDPVGVRLPQRLGPEPAPTSSSPAASPFGRGGSSWSCTQITHEPSGAREGSTAIGWPSAIVASAGSRPRSASLTARETPSRPGVRWSERGAGEALVAAPAGQLVHRDVDLHLAPAVAEAGRGVADAAPARRSRQQPPVQLGRGDAGEHRPGGGDRLAAGEPDGGRAPSETRIRSTSASVRSSPPASRTIAARPSTSFTPPPRGTGIPPSWSAQAITCVMKPDTAWSGPRPVWSTHGASRPCACSSVERVGEPVAGGEQRVPGELDEAAPAELPVGLAAEREALTRPELGAEHAERDVRARHELVELPLPRLAELGDVGGAVGREVRARAVRERGRGRQVGVQVLEPEAVEVRLQLGIGGRADPERVPGGEDLVREPGRGQAVDRLDRAAEPVVSLEHADAPAVLREERGARERVDAAADEDRVESGHAPTLLA